MPTPIIRQNTRILTPREYFLMREHLNPVYQIISDVLLNTGMRLEEFWEFLDHPEWFSPSRRCIDLPKGVIKKVKALHKERSIILTLDGCDAIQILIAIKPRRVSRVAMRDALIRATDGDGRIGSKGITPKMFRKTLISWLIKCYPERHLEVAASAGHQLETMRIHYLGIGFEGTDVEDMRKFLKGWGGG